MDDVGGGGGAEGGGGSRCKFGITLLRILRPGAIEVEEIQRMMMMILAASTARWRDVQKKSCCITDRSLCSGVLLLTHYARAKRGFGKKRSSKEYF